MNDFKTKIVKKTDATPSYKIIINEKYGTKRFRIVFFHKPISKFF